MRQEVFLAIVLTGGSLLFPFSIHAQTDIQDVYSASTSEISIDEAFETGESVQEEQKNIVSESRQVKEQPVFTRTVIEPIEPPEELGEAPELPVVPAHRHIPTIIAPPFLITQLDLIREGIAMEPAEENAAKSLLEQVNTVPVNEGASTTDSSAGTTTQEFTESQTDTTPSTDDSESLADPVSMPERSRSLEEVSDSPNTQ